MMNLKEKIAKNWFGVLTVAFSAALFLYFLMQPRTVASLGQIAHRLRLDWLLITLGAVGLGWYFESLCLHLFCAHLQPGWKVSQSFVIAMSGLLYSAITPFGTGGQPMQIYSMRKMGMDTGKAGSAIAMKTLTYQIVMVAYAMVMVASQLRYFQTSVSRFSFLTVVGLASNTLFIAAIFLFLVSRKATDKILRFLLRLLHRVRLCKKPVKRYWKIHRQFLLFHDSAKMMGRSVRLYVLVFLMTFLEITAGSLIPYFILRSFGLNGPWLLMVSAQVFVSMLAAFVPLPGASEGSFGLFFAPFFQEATLSAVLVWRLLTFYLHIGFGCAVSSIGNKKYFKLEPQKI